MRVGHRRKEPEKMPHELGGAGDVDNFGSVRGSTLPEVGKVQCGAKVSFDSEFANGQAGRVASSDMFAWMC